MAARRAGRLFVGTSGYVYRHWVRRFYPARLPPGRWLAHYAERFDTVELNSTFYRLPSARAFAAWRRQVPAGFVFAVKASRFLTHVRRLRAPSAPLARLLRRARRLEDALGPVLVQLPERFHFRARRLDGLLAALARQRLVPGLRVALEVRHASWLTDEALGRLQRANVALCLADWSALPVTLGPTADFVYVRRHGAGPRYGGRYAAAALRADARRIRGWLAGGLDVYVYFNNDERAHATADACRLRALVLGRRGAARRPAGTRRPAGCTAVSRTPPRAAGWRQRCRRSPSGSTRRAS